MRQKASELVKGEWYADVKYSATIAVFLKFSHIDDNVEFFSTQKGRNKYDCDSEGMIGFITGYSDWYLPTPEDIEKYNLNEKE